jgi:hypothetical protein
MLSEKPRTGDPLQHTGTVRTVLSATGASIAVGDLLRGCTELKNESGDSEYVTWVEHADAICLDLNRPSIQGPY